MALLCVISARRDAWLRCTATDLCGAYYPNWTKHLSKLAVARCLAVCQACSWQETKCSHSPAQQAGRAPLLQSEPGESGRERRRRRKTKIPAALAHIRAPCSTALETATAPSSEEACTVPNWHLLGRKGSCRGKKKNLERKKSGKESLEKS